MAGMAGMASFHLIRDTSALRAMARLGLDRRLLAAVPGLKFWRLLGTGDGASTGPGADLHRTALFAVWADQAAHDAFMATMQQRWPGAAEAWHVGLRAVGGHGTWRGFDVLGAIERARSSGGPVAIITRARVTPRAWRRFRTAGVPVDAELQTAPGLLAVVGIGEAPLGRLGTFSVWSNLESVVAFARNGAHHRDVVARTRAEGWYGEELFARFEPYNSAGRWDGRDPLAIGTSIP